MILTFCKQAALVIAIALATICTPATAQAAPKMGIVIMHGKGGSPTKHVAELASSLESKGYLVANLEMPWSGRRDYDTNVVGAEQEVVAALGKLRANGARYVFVAGHSQGGIFALFFGGKHVTDGIIAIAPGGNVANEVFRSKLGASVEEARKLVAVGKGGQISRFSDFEGAKGLTPVSTTPANYLSWFDPAGAMNQTIAMTNMNTKVPVLFIVPKNDYPGLLKVKRQMFDALPRHSLTQLHEPDSSHIGAPSASLDAILLWTAEVARRGNAAP